jgi:hypothetical protein
MERNHPLFAVLGRVGISKTDLQVITSRKAVISILSDPEAELDEKIEAWLKSVGVNLEGFKTQLATFWKRTREGNDRTTKGGTL